MASDLLSEFVDQLNIIVKDTHQNEIRQAMVGAPTADVEPMEVILKFSVRAVRSRQRLYLLYTPKCVADHMATLEAARMIQCNKLAMYRHGEMALSRVANSFRLVSFIALRARR